MTRGDYTLFKIEAAHTKSGLMQLTVQKESTMENTPENPQNLGETYGDTTPTAATGESLANVMSKMKTDLKDQADKAIGRA